MVLIAWKFAEAKKEKHSLNSCWCLYGISHWWNETFLLWAAVSEGEKVGGTSSSYLMSTARIYPPVHPSASDTCFLWAILWVLKDVSLERVGCPAQENCPRLATWVLKENWVMGNGSRNSEKHGRKCKQKAIKGNKCHKHRWNYQRFVAVTSVVCLCCKSSLAIFCKVSQGSEELKKIIINVKSRVRKQLLKIKSVRCSQESAFRRIKKPYATGSLWHVGKVLLFSETD